MSRKALVMLVTGLVAFAVSGCWSSASKPTARASLGPVGTLTLHPTTTATTAPTTPATPAPSRVRVTVRPTLITSIRPLLLGDLQIGLARSGACTWYVGKKGGLWIDPLLLVTWTGTGPVLAPALVSFNMKTNYGEDTAGGTLQPGAATTWAIGGEPVAGNSWLAHSTVIITLTVDPTFEVAESNESNNVSTITVTIPSTPPSTKETPIACS